MTFARIRDACAPFDSRDFVFFVLTLDRDGYYSNKRWLDADGLASSDRSRLRAAA